MCRSSAQGGRRCPGRGSAPATSPAATATAPTIGSGVPTRERADQLAAMLPAGRTGWDGQPLDAKGRRLYALRESGYSGPIDQDGYPDTTSKGADVLRHMATQTGETVDW